MIYIHTSALVSHGHLAAYNCVVDSRFLVKISNFGLTSFVDTKDLLPPVRTDQTRDFNKLLWRAPELLRHVMPPNGTPVSSNRRKGHVVKTIFNSNEKPFSFLERYILRSSIDEAVVSFLFQVMFIATQ